MGLFDFLKGLFNNQTFTNYDYNDIAVIRSIPVPTVKQNKILHDIKDDLPYILQRKATEHKRDGKMDLAIECLRKSNELMPFSAYIYSQDDYMRLVEFLKRDRQFELAKKEEAIISEMFQEPEMDTSFDMQIVENTLQNAQILGTDLLEMSEHSGTCGECAKYQGRVFSISGASKKFPKLPEAFFKYGGIHEGCRHDFFPFIDGVSTPTYHKNIVQYSNKPFLDKRTKAEKEMYEQKIKDERDYAQDKIDYDWVWENLPTLSPKSFSGYRRMKNSNSKNYIKIVEAAKEKEYYIEN